MIFFDKNKQAYAYPIENSITSISDEIWEKYADTDKWDIVDNQFIDISNTENYLLKELQKAKESKIAEINTAKELAFKSGIVFKGSHYDCDDRAQDRTGNRLILLNAMPVETLEWLDYEYKAQTLTTQEFQQLCASIFERIQFIEFKTGQFLESVNLAKNIEELESLIVDFSQIEENKEETENVI